MPSAGASDIALLASRVSQLMQERGRRECAAWRICVWMSTCTNIMHTDWLTYVYRGITVVRVTMKTDVRASRVFVI
eukprot:688083-Amphidinium_carterae.1